MSPSRLKWEGFEGLSDARLSMIITQTIQIHNYSDLTEQKMLLMFSGSLWFFLGGGDKKLYTPTPSLKGEDIIGKMSKDDRIYTSLPRF